MKQKRPFIVEIKPSRRSSKQGERSIWGNVDLTAFSVDTMEAEPKDALQTDRSTRDVKASGPSEPSRSPRILPTLVTSAPNEELEDAATMTVAPELETPAKPNDSDPVPSMTSAKRVRRSRLRRTAEKPLPAGQRWKRRLPKILR